VFDVSSSRQEDWHFRALQDIAPGDELTFFYPSTEWSMSQPFECRCGTKLCLTYVEGASKLSSEQLERFGFINPHIWRLVQARDGRNRDFVVPSSAAVVT